MARQRMPRRGHKDPRGCDRRSPPGKLRSGSPGGRRGGESARAVASERPGLRSGPGPPCSEAWASCLPPLRPHPLYNENKSVCHRVLGKGCTGSCVSGTGPSSSPRSVPLLKPRPREGADLPKVTQQAVAERRQVLVQCPSHPS